MKNVVKAAAVAALMIGASSAAHAMGSNHGKVTFFGTVEESPCSIKTNDEDQRIPMGSIGTGAIAGGKKSNEVDFQIHLVNCNFQDNEKTMSVTFTGTPASVATKNLALLGEAGELKGASLGIGDAAQRPIDLGTALSQTLTTSNGTANASQTFDLTAWVIGDAGTTYPNAGTIDVGAFETPANFVIEYQ